MTRQFAATQELATFCDAINIDNLAESRKTLRQAQGERINLLI
jgi:hypothetical protein